MPQWGVSTFISDRERGGGVNQSTFLILVKRVSEGLVKGRDNVDNEPYFMLAYFW